MRNRRIRRKIFGILKYEALESFVKSLYTRLSGSDNEPPGTITFHSFDLRNGQLYYKDNVNPLTTKNRVGVLADRLGKEGLHDLGFDVPVGKITGRQFMASYKAGSQLPSTSDITRADDIELQEIVENASRSIENLNQQVQGEPTEDLPMQELLGLDKQLRRQKRFSWKNTSRKSNESSRIREYPGEYNDGIRENITKRIDALNDKLKVRQESIDLLKGRLKNQITSFRKTIAKVLDSNTSLAEKIRTLLGEQGITIASILTAIGITIGVLVEALLPGSGGGATSGDEPPPNDKKGLKEWIRSKLKALALLLGKLGIKVAEALVSLGGIISWILNRAADVMGWASQNLWALVVGVGGLIYTYMVTRR